MNLRFFMDPETGEPHFERHGIEVDDVQAVLRAPLETRRGRNGASIALGRAPDGRFVRVVYVDDADRKGRFIITALAIGPRATWALRRRMRRKR